MKKLFGVKKLGLISMTLLMVFFVACGKKEETRSELTVGCLKGATTIGIVKMMELNETNETMNDYSFVMETAVDALLPQIIKGEIDIALVPANVASNIYQKTEGKVVVVDINTLGVLSLVTADDSISTMADLKGKTIYLTGKGTTPEYALKYLLEKNHISMDEVILEFRSEATEVASVLASDDTAIGLLPQPFVTVACNQNKNLEIKMELSKEWDAISNGDSRLVTGVTIVRKEVLEEKEAAVLNFMKEHKESVDYVNNNVKESGALVAKYEIIQSEDVASIAIPKCNITYIDGSEMQTALSGYLNTLYQMDENAVGGSVPSEDFYFIR